jgi:ribonuclease R
MKREKQERFLKELLQFLEAHPDQIYKGRELAHHLGVINRDYQKFKRMVRQFAEEGLFSRHKGNKYGVVRKQSTVTGNLHVKSQGYGFVRRDDGSEDVFISQKNMNSALHGDRVRVELWAQPVGRLPEGKVVEILERGRSRIVGTFQEARTYNYIIPDELKITRDVVVSEKDRGTSRAGQKVVVEIKKWGDTRRMPEGKVVEVLGYPDEKGVDVLSITTSFDLPRAFPKRVKEETENISGKIPASALQNRLDLRDKLVFTVDPADAKDFDDAISLERLSEGNLLLGVHISDVSRFVPPGSALDREALRRGTSVYLVDRVIPMFPERLSNDLCSLRPAVDRLTYSVLMELTPEGVIEDYQIRETVIHSRCRLTYQEVQRMIDGYREGTGNRDSGSEIRVRGDELADTLLRMAELSRKLLARWRLAGSIDFDAPEAEVVLDDRGRPVSLGVKERLESHRLIEAFMLLANRTVAEHIQRLRRETGGKYAFVYRIHEKPEGKKLDEFVRFIRVLGYAFDVGKKVTPKKFQGLLKQVKGTRHEIIVEDVALRTMMKAMYSTRNVGHFGLAFKHYTHFTSPVRRYPDLMVHRLLKAYSQGESRFPEYPVKLSKICEIASEREITAQEAERECIKAKQVEFMAARIGEEFDGVISGVVSFGVFVEIPEYLVEGLIHVRDLDDDDFAHDEGNYCLIGRKKGRVYRLGDPIRVRVDRVWREMRKIDFVVADTENVRP